VGGRLPYSGEDTQVMYDDVQKKQVSCETGNQDEQHRINNFPTLFPYGIQGTDSSSVAEIQKGRNDKQKYTDTSKRPLVLTVERVGQRTGKTNAREAQKNKYQGA